jgi:hypothetical protein
MFAELDLLGAFVPAIAAWFVAAIAIFTITDAVMTWVGFYRLFWHPPLVRFGLFVCLFCTGCIGISTS